MLCASSYFVLALSISRCIVKLHALRGLAAVKIRSRAEIVADFPDDSIEDDDDIIQFGGRGLAEAIVEMLRRLGYEVSTPEHRDEHGWDFTVRSNRKKVWMQVTDLRTEYVLSTDYIWSLRAFLSKEQMYAPLLRRLNQEFARDPRFKNVSWYGAYEPGGRGAANPVDD